MLPTVCGQLLISKLLTFLTLKMIFRCNFLIYKLKCRRGMCSYVQGQEPEPKVREYFYYIDHQGMLFLDDSRMKNFTSCFKDKKFLRFFFSQLKINNTDRYREFPYISLCGKERNFIRCDDYPFVFTHVISDSEGDLLGYNHAGDLLTHKFVPEKIFMLPETGRVYHPAPEKVGSIGLVRSKLANEFSKHFKFANGETNPPTQFTWNGKLRHLDLEWYQQAIANDPSKELKMLK